MAHSKRQPSFSIHGFFSFQIVKLFLRRYFNHCGALIPTCILHSKNSVSENGGKRNVYVYISRGKNKEANMLFKLPASNRQNKNKKHFNFEKCHHFWVEQNEKLTSGLCISMVSLTFLHFMATDTDIKYNLYFLYFISIQPIIIKWRERETNITHKRKMKMCRWHTSMLMVVLLNRPEEGVNVDV